MPELLLLSAPSAGAGVPLRELSLVLLVGAITTYLLTGVMRWLIMSYGKVDMPRERDIHTQPKPRMGGVAMFTGFALAIYFASLLPALNRGFPPQIPDMVAVMAAAFVIVITGVIDDLYDIAWWLKLGGQVGAAALMTVLGLSWYLLYLPTPDGGVTLVLDQVQSGVATAFLTVVIVNAVNFVDGIDGLAAGMGCIGGGTILIYSLTILYDQGGAVSAYPPAMISAALTGMCLGFLPHNFSPSRIFMGDSGSMLIGLLLSAACVSASGRITMSLYGAADVLALMSPIIVVAAALSLPVIDLILAVVRRVSAGRSPFEPDRRHLHHRLLDLGHSTRRVVTVLYSWVAVAGLAAVGSSVLPAHIALPAGFIAIAAVAVLTVIPLFRGRLNRADRLAAAERAAAAERHAEAQHRAASEPVMGARHAVDARSGVDPSGVDPSRNPRPSAQSAAIAPDRMNNHDAPQ